MSDEGATSRSIGIIRPPVHTSASSRPTAKPSTSARPPSTGTSQASSFKPSGQASSFNPHGGQASSFNPSGTSQASGQASSFNPYGGQASSFNPSGTSQASSFKPSGQASSFNPSASSQAAVFNPSFNSAGKITGGTVTQAPSRPSGFYSKPQTLKLEDTNVAGIGSDADKQSRYDASNKEPAWNDVGKAPGLIVWRIEQFKVKAWPREQYGTFLDGDSYIVLSTYDKGNGALGYDLHFWLGGNTSQDEAGTAAYKTVELDDHLHGAAVQHRQVQGHEDELFLSYWKPAMCVTSGGVATGFKHWSAPEFPKKLYMVQGTKRQNVRVQEIQYTYQAVNSGEVFVIDTGKQLYQFNGTHANAFERSQSMQFCAKTVKERTPAVKHIVIEQGDPAQQEFLSLLGAPAGYAIPTNIAPEESLTRAIEELKVHAASPPYNLIAAGFGVKSVMKSDAVIVFDAGEKDGVFVWVGKNIPAQQARTAMQIGLEFLKYTRKPLWAPLHRVIEGRESKEFKAIF